MRAVALVPARLGSSRLPGKVLADLAGRPMVVRVLERLRGCREIAEIAVATDDRAVADAVRAAGFLATLTRSDHPSGTDRIAEVALGMQAEIIVNVQGDEPFVDPALVDALVVAVRQGAVIATACAPFEGDPAEPSRVKVVRSAKGQALYFSRAPIPAGGPYYQHIGLYAFRRATLLQVTALPPSPLEQSERLEQLRWLEAGLPIQLVPTQAPSLAVDTPADLARARAMLGAPKQGGDP